MSKPFPPEFRRDAIAVARKSEPLWQIAKDFGISEIVRGARPARPLAAA
jgi:transposase